MPAGLLVASYGGSTGDGCGVRVLSWPQLEGLAQLEGGAACCVLAGGQGLLSSLLTGTAIIFVCKGSLKRSRWPAWA